MNTSELFIKGLKEHNRELIEKTPKADLHNHGILGGQLADLEKWLGKKLPSPPRKITLFSDFDAYIDNILSITFSHGPQKGQSGLEKLFEIAFKQAVYDKIANLEMSIDSRFATFYPTKAAGLTEAIKKLHRTIAPQISFTPELGIARDIDIHEAYTQAEDFLSTGYYKAIDLYGDEFAHNARDYKKLYQQAAKMGLKLKAHVGEYGNAESVRNTIETLELKIVQHGISSANSQEIMAWLRKNNIQLNICPSSNVILTRVPELKVHPIRRLFDNRIRVTVNTDDILIFGQSISDEFINLYNCGLFSAEELDIIRLNGLNSN